MRFAGAPWRWPPAVYALVDQAIVSGASFVTMICVARWLSAEAYGAYALLFGVCLLVAALQRAWVTQPLDVMGATEASDSLQRRRVAASRLSDLSALFGSALLAGVVLWIGEGVYTWLAATAYLAVFFRHELLRRVFYTAGRTSSALAPSAVAYGLGLVAVLTLSLGGAPSSAAVALGIAAAGLAAGWVMGLRSARRSFGPVPTLDSAEVRRLALQHAHFARWLVITQLVLFGSTEVYAYYIYAELSAAEAGTFRAASSIVNISNIVRMTLVNYLPRPMALAQARDGIEGLRHTAARTWVLVLVLGMVIAAGLSALSGWIEHVLYAAKYEDVGRVIVWMAWLQPLSLAGAVASIAASVMLRTQHVFIAHATGGAFSLLFGWWLVKELGVTGGLIGLSAGLILPAVIQTALLAHSMRRQPAPPVPTRVEPRAGV